MHKSTELLSKIVVWNKYGRFLYDQKRRERYEEIVDRNKQMHIDKFPELTEEINAAYEQVYSKNILPSMRSFQFAGDAIRQNNARIFNCSYLPIERLQAFQELMFLLLSGCGVGYSVRGRHVEALGTFYPLNGKKTETYIIPDSIEGWAMSIDFLIRSLKDGYEPVFDYSNIRKRGERLVVGGGKAPGAEPLRTCHQEIINYYKDYGLIAPGTLEPIMVHDICCLVSEAVMAGGIRRAAMISLFDHDDEAMLSCKSGDWWMKHPYRARANNSAVLHRAITEEDFKQIWRQVEESNAGEPGLFWVNDILGNAGTNPCGRGDMRILTHSGYKRLDECVGDGVFINKNGEAVSGEVWSTGVKPTVCLTLSNRTKLVFTENHKFMVNTGEEVEAKDLMNLRLMPHFEINQEVSEFTKYGYIQGDGVTSDLLNKTKQRIGICFGEKDGDMLDLFGINKDESTTCSYYVSGYNDTLTALGFDTNTLPTRALPSTFSSWQDKDKLMFLKGMYSANGSIITTSRVAYKTTSKELSEELTYWLTYFGMNSYITTNKETDVVFANGTYTCRESYDINIGQFEDILKFAKLIGFVHQYKQDRLRNLILKRAPKVISIKPAGEAEVFDFSLDDNTHWGVVEGVIAHNCCEIALRPYTFCNLVETPVTGNEEEDLRRVKAAAFIATLQASYTDFKFLSPEWKINTDEDALIGVGLTGIAGAGEINYAKLAEAVKETNAEVAARIGINTAARCTTVKPSGTASIVLGTSSGIHAWHSKYYIRRMRVSKNDALYSYVLKQAPFLVEDDFFKPQETAVLSFPIKAPDRAITREDESAIEFADRCLEASVHYVRNGQNRDDLHNNVSATVSVKKSEWPELGNWMYENREFYNGMSVLPYDDSVYKQAPFETITEEEYLRLEAQLEGIDLDPSSIIEEDDLTELIENSACAGGACELV